MTATQTIDHAAAVAAAGRAVEEAFDGDSGHVTCDEWDEQLEHAVDNWLAARRAAKAAGFVEALVSKEMFEAYDKAMKFGGCNPNDVDDFFDVFQRDLGPLLKDEGEG